MRSNARTSAPRWPFWLLITAWVCANSPQAATYALLTWMAEARSFTHQQRLTLQTAALLGGNRDAASEVNVAGTAALPLPPAVPPDAVLKKFPLSLERALDLPAPRAQGVCVYEECGYGLGEARPAPPHGPPRVTNLS